MQGSLNLDFYKSCLANLETIQQNSHNIKPILFPEINFYSAGLITENQ